MAEIAAILERMRATRGTVQERLKEISEQQMLAPAEWAHRQFNVRFLFYRLIAHEAEHTIHLAKALSALGIAQGEASLILRRLQEARAELEGLLIGLPDDALDQAPAEGEWPVRQILEHIETTEERISRQIVEASEAAKYTAPG